MHSENTTNPKLSKSEQARINGAKSQGPKTAAGKAISSLNALKHAEYSEANRDWLPIENGVLSGESRHLTFAIFQAYFAQFRPESDMEIHLVKKIVFHQANLDRLDKAEATLLQMHWNDVTPPLFEAYALEDSVNKQEHPAENAPPTSVCATHAILAMATKDDKILRTITRLRRDHERSLREYTRRLKEAKKSFPAANIVGLGPVGLTVEPTAETALDYAPAFGLELDLEAVEEAGNEPKTEAKAPTQAAPPKPCNQDGNEPNAAKQQPEPESREYDDSKDEAAAVDHQADEEISHLADTAELQVRQQLTDDPTAHSPGTNLPKAA